MSTVRVDHAKVAGICVDNHWNMRDLKENLMELGIALAPDDLREIKDCIRYLKERLSTADFCYGVTEL